MCLEYFKNVYKNVIVRRDTPNLDFAELVKITHTSYSNGTRDIEDGLRALSEKTKCLEFELINGGSFNVIKKNLEKNLPVIVIYNCAYFLQQERGPGHAGVVIGITKDALFLNNPWLGPDKCISKVEFEPAWEIEYKKLILIKPNPQERLRNA
jgi:hypothetical protein